MLTVTEAAQRGMSPDPFAFQECGANHGRTHPSITYYQSRWFFVQATEVVTLSDVPMTWLSMRRNDRKPLDDFRHLQRIKNAICGPEREACQLYPAESRLMDAANQTHLWVLPEEQVFPWGYGTREVLTATEVARLQAAGLGVGSAQRPFSEEEEVASRPVSELPVDAKTTMLQRTIHQYCRECGDWTDQYPECPQGHDLTKEAR